MEKPQTVFKGHIRGQMVVLDDAVPPDLPENAPVWVVLDEGDREHVLSRIARLARQGHLPGDYSQQHEHYTKSGPRR